MKATIAVLVIIARVAAAEPGTPTEQGTSYQFYAEPSGFAGSSQEYKLLFRLAAGVAIRPRLPDDSHDLVLHVGLTLTLIDPEHSSGFGGEVVATYPLVWRLRGGVHLGFETSGQRQLLTYGLRLQIADAIWGGVDLARTFGQCQRCGGENAIFGGLGFEGRGIVAVIGAAIASSIIIGVSLSNGFHL